MVFFERDPNYYFFLKVFLNKQAYTQTDKSLKNYVFPISTFNLYRLGHVARARCGGGGEGPRVAVPARRDARAVAGLLRPDPTEAGQRVRAQQGGDARRRRGHAAHSARPTRASGEHTTPHPHTPRIQTYRRRTIAVFGALVSMIYRL